MPPIADAIAAFEANRSLLMGLAYRILGSRADAEDAVQDTFLKWSEADHATIDNAASWLTTACTRRCIDVLRSAHRSRVDYVGSWLPEPIHTAVDDMQAEHALLASSLGTAFLLMLERLTPKERAAYLLHEIFDRPYPEIASILDMQETACRKLVSRARENIEKTHVRHVTPRPQQEQLLAAFESAVLSGDTSGLAGLLAEDIALRADGGGKVTAVREVLHGKQRVLDFLAVMQRYWSDYRWVFMEINGSRGLSLEDDGGESAASVTFDYDDAGRVRDIFIMRNPDKLGRLHAPPIT
ncbi:RNA polymerase sigma-70 factor (ECF subfamily) [Lysobacter niastensis]|uniref:RNA polymerase sigma-70 factor (ECF subfamily) n=1 Tax=Lysobacter niastensis TaxID=380629 RepID=A0ABU1W6H4_9GAMM|nr:RNA polymerase sigma factor SigJ [Lysobacter niastensis]MDR7133174.1 RNA polymerase sigma-70 factor (ECF subfamily) [Lysobacter niastensis]